MTRYAVETAQREGEEIVVLRDTQRGAEARVWPACGNNCFQVVLPAPARAGSGGGRLVTVVHDPPALAEIRRAPSWWGIPLLFPFPGSMPGGTYAFEGRTLRLGHPEQPVVNEPTYLGPERPANARRDYHGFVMDLPWQVAETQATDDVATVRSTLDSVDFAEEHVGFPFPYRVEATYRLDAQGLRLDFRAVNTGSGRLPFGFGAHPFLRLPLGPHGSPGECLLCIPAARRWGRGLRSVLEDPSLPLPPQDEITPPVSEELDLRTSKPFAERVYNGMYTDLALQEGHDHGSKQTSGRPGGDQNTTLGTFGVARITASNPLAGSRTNASTCPSRSARSVYIPL